MVEALTIVLGVGVVRGWRSTLIGVGAAGAVLVLLVALLGPALQRIPIQGLRLVVGALLLAFGLQWLKKAILRSSGYKALHDEREAFREGQAQAAAGGAEQRAGLDWYSFTVAFKGVLLEGLEVVFIVIAFGSAQGTWASPSPAPPRRWSSCSSRAWPRAAPCRACPRTRSSSPSDFSSRRSAASGPPRAPASTGPGTSLPARGARIFRARLGPARAHAAPSAPTRACGSEGMKYLRTFGRFWWDFVVGDDWRLAAE